MSRLLTLTFTTAAFRTEAAYGSLKPPPTRRLRRVLLHLSYSTTISRLPDTTTPGALAPVRVMLSRSINAQSAPSAPLEGTSRLHRIAAYTRCLRCAYSHMPRRPTTGSELSSMLFRNMSSSTTTGNSSAAYTQYFTEDAGLQPGLKVSAFPLSSHSDSSEGWVFEA